MTEEQLQSQCTLWFWNEFPTERRMLFHVDNNSYNSIIGAKKRALGVCKGPSDLVLILCGKVVFIEMKLDSGTQSEEQKDFEEKVKEREHQYVIIRSFEAFKKFVLKKLTENEKYY